MEDGLTHFFASDEASQNEIISRSINRCTKNIAM